ncbi:MAG: glycosyltransferase [Nostoc sp. EfeVER01]|uniref:glycosyltransferase n=1 Tax=unclassified Nostoc TaxID=2593658 RepID=UPI002AD5AD7D|nr:MULTISPECIES: glycosyltransferase [unclassified Nostoc]MDZ7946037.1 glycosyltransferase [Nostoc sp. EfeVER01]MDZ7993357.1 glycosyltransferase [Nostoc sp. EspVER01]
MSLAEFESEILKTIDAGDLNSALNLIIHFAHKIAYGKASVITITNVFGSVILDQLCQRIGSKLLKIQKSFLENQYNPDDELIIYIATQLYKTGGHTAVIEDLIKARPEKKHLILITDTFNSTDRPAVEDRLRSLNVQILWATNGTSIDKLRWLQQALIANLSNQVFLFNHPQDAVAVAAVQPNLTPNLIFYHHAGHLLCLGVYLSYAQHIDSDPGSFYNCRHNLGISNNIYLPLVVDNIPDRHSSSFVSNGQLRTCSSGSENKFKEIPYLYSYIHEVPKIIASTGGFHIHIGDLSQHTLSVIERGLGEFRISLERFIHIPWVKSLGRAMSEHKIDIYLESFPLGGGRAGIEVMASGTPIVVHNNYRSRQLCSTDLAYPEAFRWQTPDELYRYLRNISSEALKTESVYSRIHYQKNHIPQILPKLLKKIELRQTTPIPDELKPYYKNDLQSFFDKFFAITNPSVIEDILSLGIQNNQPTQTNYQNKQHYLIEKNIRTKVEQEIRNESPLVSICIPTYNGEDFIVEAINSVLKQTYPNIEIIISDDNSRDDTVNVANSFKQESSFEFSILQHSQYGLAQNWNFCISQAKGKYIKFLFQDDLLESTAIEEMVNLAEQDEEIGLVFSPRTLFTNIGHTVYDSNFLMHHEAKDVHKAWSKLKTIQSGQELLLDPHILDNPINKIGEPSTVMIRKNVFEKVGLFNSEFCQLVDLEMWLRIMSQYKIGFVNKILSHFRIHPQQQTRRNAALKDAILLDYQKLFKTIYSDTRYPQATRQQALYRYATLSEQNAELHQLRKQITEECLNASDEQITDMYLGLLGKTHKMLVNSSIKYESLANEEQIFVNNIVTTISQGFEQPKAIQSLLAAMLYCRADQLPLQCDLSHIPHWLVQDYLQFLFSSPVHFQEPGEADNYYYFMQGWINYLHTSILQNSDSQSWDTILNNFVSISNFIALYFNDHNLKDIYVKRAGIIEYLLKVKGYKVDYEFVDRPITRKKIRLGVLAAHFLPGSETFAYLPVYEYISRDFEVILYSLNQTGHKLEQYCQSCANSFKLLPQDLVEQVNIIRADDLDILFIATNVTAVTNQICLLSMHRLARIQITSGGSVVTTGMRHIDYYISGTLTDPSATAEQQYQEKLVKLEGSAHCFSYGNEEENVIVKVDRESLGISEETVIFISGANFFKIIPELINTWAKIISGVPNSVLVLLPFGPNWSNNYPKKAFVNHLMKVFSKHGISAEKLIVLDPQPVPNRQEVKEYFKIADIYLDSFPFSGTTSLIEPLQVNLPVIARLGTSFRSTMGAAMVQTLDIPDLVADSEESYIQLAIALGNNPKLRQQKSAEIKAKMQANPSFLDSRSYSDKIGSLFQELFSKYLADTLSQNFRLGDINLIIFPDWLQPEDLLYQDLASVISTLTTHPDKSNLTLLIDTQNISEEEADMLLSSLTMNLLMEDDVDITEGPEISLLSKMSDTQWKTLLPRIQTRIALATDNQQAIAQAKAETLLSCDVDSLSAS